MRTKIIFLVFLMSYASCGGGSSGTALGPPNTEREVKFSGVVITNEGRELAFAKITLLNTDQSVLTDEAGAFELNADLPDEAAVLEIAPQDEQIAVVAVEDLAPGPQTVELSIAYNESLGSAELLALTLRARIVRSCSPLFLNTRTIQQTAPVSEGVICTVEAEFKSDGLPADGIVFELQHRGCSADDPWQFSDVAVTGTSGPGFGEIDFKFRNDQNHCVYRVVGPLGVEGSQTISAQIHTLRKIEFDRNS